MKQHNVTQSPTQKVTPRGKARAPRTAQGPLERMDVRVSKLELAIVRFQRQLEGSEIALAAAELRSLNERQAHDGLERLRGDLHALRERGIIDEQGRRVKRDLPAEMLESDTDVV